MAQKSALSCSTISNYFKINHKQLKRGELSFLARYDSKISFDPNGLIKGDVKASMKQTTYHVQVILYSFIIGIICSHIGIKSV